MPIVAKLDELGKPAWIALSNGRGMSRWWGPADQIRPAGTWWQPSPRPSGNRAFDEYRQDTLRRLEEEFHEFLRRLRMAKDKAEFDQFMAERRTRSATSSSQSSDPSPSQN
jgi:hypothetical protein